MSTASAGTIASPPRWSAEETKKIAQIRARLGPVLLDRPQFPDVVGDRKLVRFLRGHEHNVDKVCEMVTNFLKWRDDNNMDEVRERIIRGGLNHPRSFPLGEKILQLIPQVVIAYDACDKFGAPICVDQYNFSPATVMASISVPDYIVFQAYCLEYKMMIVEQMSEHRERLALQQSHSASASASSESGAAAAVAGGAVSDTTSGGGGGTDGEGGEGHEKAVGAVASAGGHNYYGVLVNTCVIRDLGAVGFEHVGAKGQEIIQAVISLAGPNYPELMRKCFMINAPWVFNALWYFIKGLLPARTVAKVDLMGSGFMAKIEEEISLDCLPSLVGGKHTKDEPFSFDLEYYAASPYFLLSYPLGGPPVASTPSSSSGSSSDGSSGSVVSISSGSDVYGGLMIEDADGTVLTLSSQSSMTDLARPLCVTVSTGARVGAGAAAKTGSGTGSASTSTVVATSTHPSHHHQHHPPSPAPTPSCSGSQPVLQSSAYAVQLARFFSWAAAKALITNNNNNNNNISPPPSSLAALHCTSRVVVDFDCGCGLLACLLAAITTQQTTALNKGGLTSSSPSSGSTPGAGSSPGPSPSPCVRAVCCHEDISNGCFEALHKNTTHAGQGLAATTTTTPSSAAAVAVAIAESSVTVTATVVTKDATKSTAVTTASSSSSSSATATAATTSVCGITLHEYHHQVTAAAKAPGLASGSAPGPGLGQDLALDRCPSELVVGVDTVVLRLETFLRTRASVEGGHSGNSHALDITDKSSAGADHTHHHHHHSHSHSHHKGKSHGHSDHGHPHPPSSSSYSSSSSLKNLQHFVSSLFSSDGDAPSSNTITTVLLTVQASTARQVFMTEDHVKDKGQVQSQSHGAHASDGNGNNHDHDDKEKEKENDITTSSTTTPHAKHAGLRSSVEGAMVVAQALKVTLPATLAANMRIVTSPDNRCHFIVASAGQSTGAIAIAAGADKDKGSDKGSGKALEWCVEGQVVYGIEGRFTA